MFDMMDHSEKCPTTWPLPSPAPDTCWVYLVRHGSTANNRAKPPRLQGRRSDVPLSEQGKQEAERAGRFLARLPLDAVFSSPLLRARQTAQAIASCHRLDVQVIEPLVEVDVGKWEGMSWQQIEKTHPQQYAAFMSNAVENPYLGGETVADVLARVAPAMDQLAAANLGKRIAVVAHNIVNRAFLASIMEIPLVSFRLIRQDNCGINLLRCRGGQWKAISINCVFHLPDKL